MNLKNIIFSERIQTKKGHMLYDFIYIKWIIIIKVDWWLLGPRRRTEWGITVYGYGVALGVILCYGSK